MNVRRLYSYRILVASFMAAMLVVGLLTALVIRQQHDQANGQVYLEAGGSVGANPFVPLAIPPQAAGQNVGGEGASFQPVASAGNRTSFDSERLASFLVTHPKVAAAWVKALNSDPTLSWSGGNRIEVQQIPAYIHELTPRNLDEDLKVTNHQFANGIALAVQSILEKGTPVLVDAKGFARIRCISGSPLALPIIQPKAHPTYRGTPWPGFQPQRVAIQRGPQCGGGGYYDGEHCRHIPVCPRGDYRGSDGRCHGSLDPCPGREVRGDDGRCYYPDQYALADNSRRPDPPGQPYKSAQPGQPAPPDHPEQPKRPDMPAQPGQPKRPDKPAKPAQPKQPHQPTQPTKPEKPKQAEKPEKPKQQNKPAKSVQPAKPDQPKQPKNSVKPDQAKQPNKPAKPDQPKQSDKPGKPN